jgi:hypothetical protein
MRAVTAGVCVIISYLGWMTTVAHAFIPTTASRFAARKSVAPLLVLKDLDQDVTTTTSSTTTTTTTTNQDDNVAATTTKNNSLKTTTTPTTSSSDWNRIPGSLRINGQGIPARNDPIQLLDSTTYESDWIQRWSQNEEAQQGFDWEIEKLRRYFAGLRLRDDGACAHSLFH